MTEERIAIIEKYLGSKTSTGLLVQAWHELRGALSNLHASLVLAHCTPDQVAERGRILAEKSSKFDTFHVEMQAELALYHQDINSDFIAQANEPSPDRSPVDFYDAGYELGGEG